MEAKAIRVRRVAEVDRKACVACGECLNACRLAAIRVVGGMYAEVAEKKCVGCGRCAAFCPASAIQMAEVVR